MKCGPLHAAFFTTVNTFVEIEHAEKFWE